MIIIEKIDFIQGLFFYIVDTISNNRAFEIIFDSRRGVVEIKFRLSTSPKYTRL